MEFDQVPTGQRLVFLSVRLTPQIPGSHLRDGYEFLLFGGVGLGHGNRDIRLIESGDLIAIGNLGIDLMCRAIGQVQMECLRAFADQDSLAGKRDSRGRGHAGVGDEDPLPDGRALGRFDVLNVEHESGEAFVENARLNFERDLRGLQAVLQVNHGGLGLGSEIDSVGQGEKPGRYGEDRYDAEEAPDADAAGSHGGDFAVGGEAAEADQNAYQHARRNADGERYRNDEEEDFGNTRQRSAVANYQFEDLSKVASE